MLEWDEAVRGKTGGGAVEVRRRTGLVHLHVSGGMVLQARGQAILSEGVGRTCRARSRGTSHW